MSTDARRLVRDAARTLSARARAGVVRPDRRRHLRLPRRSRSDCRSARSSRRAGSPSRWTVDSQPPAQLLADPHWLPFPENSLDLIVLPHALEFTSDPHQLLREVYRAMRAEGQIVISGLQSVQPVRRQALFRARRRSPPWNGSFIALYRLKDWLALLGFEVTGGGLDCYVPPFAQREMARALRLLRGGGRPLVADRAAACTTCGRRRRSSACASSRRRGSAARTASPRAPRQARRVHRVSVRAPGRRRVAERSAQRERSVRPQ